MGKAKRRRTQKEFRAQKESLAAWLAGWVGEKHWERQMASDREALQGHLDFILREVRASCQCFPNWRAARSALPSESLDSTLNTDWVVREPLGPVTSMSTLKWLAEGRGCGSRGKGRENTWHPRAKSQTQKLADGE